MSTNPEVQCWAKVAAKTGGHLHVRHIFRGPRQDRRRFGLPSIRAEINGVSVQGEVTGEGDPPATFANLSAWVPGAVGLKLRVYKNYLYSQFSRVAGVRDFVLGDPHFDRNFVVKSSDPHYARLWLSPAVRKMMVGAPDYCFEIDSEHASGTTHLADDAQQLEAALRTIAELARHGAVLNEQVARVAKQLGSDSALDASPWFTGLSPEFEFISGGRKVSMNIMHARTGRRGAQRLLSRLWCRRLTARSDRFLFYSDHLPRRERPALANKLARCDLGAVHPPGYVVHASNPERLKKRVSEHWSKAITRLAPLVLSCSEAAVEMVWAGAVLHEQRMRDAADLCEYFAVESRGVLSSGPYR